MADLVKILLVDDNPKFLEDVLPYYGYDVVVATNGREALNYLEKSSKYDLVLLDVMMPELNGWEILKFIRKNPIYGDIPVIMVTAVNEEQKMISGLRIGADDYVVKPFVLPNLLARMEAVLRRSKRPYQKDLSNNVTNNKKSNINALTGREKDVLLLVTQGESNKSIADKLVLSEVTVKSHLSSIFKKLNVTNRTQAVLLAMQMDLVEK